MITWVITHPLEWAHNCVPYSPALTWQSILPDFWLNIHTYHLNLFTTIGIYWARSRKVFTIIKCVIYMLTNFHWISTTMQARKLISKQKNGRKLLPTSEQIENKFGPRITQFSLVEFFYWFWNIFTVLTPHQSHFCYKNICFS